MVVSSSVMQAVTSICDVLPLPEHRDELLVRCKTQATQEDAGQLTW